MKLAEVKVSDYADNASRVPRRAAPGIPGGFNAFRSAEQAAGIELCGVVHSDERQLSLY